MSLTIKRVVWDATQYKLVDGPFRERADGAP